MSHTAATGISWVDQLASGIAAIFEHDCAARQSGNLVRVPDDAGGRPIGPPATVPYEAGVALITVADTNWPGPTPRYNRRPVRRGTGRRPCHQDRFSWTLRRLAKSNGHPVLSRGRFGSTDCPLLFAAPLNPPRSAILEASRGGGRPLPLLSR